MSVVAEVFSEAELQACESCCFWGTSHVIPPGPGLGHSIEALCGSHKGLTTLLLWAPWHAPSVHLTKAGRQVALVISSCFMCTGWIPGVGRNCRRTEDGPLC